MPREAHILIVDDQEDNRLILEDLLGGQRSGRHPAGWRRHTRDVALLTSDFDEDGNSVSFVLGEMCVAHSRQL